MRRPATLAALLALAACGGGESAGFYDDGAKNVAERHAADRVEPKGHGRKISTGNVEERSECPQHAGPCLAVELEIADQARPVGGGDSVGTARMTSDVFVWLARKGGKWKVTHVVNGPPRDVSFNGVPYTPDHGFPARCAAGPGRAALGLAWVGSARRFWPRT